MTIDWAAIIIGAIGWLGAIWSYYDKKRIEHQNKEYEMTLEVIKNEKLSRMQSMIEQEDQTLEEMLDKLNVAQNATAEVPLTPEEKKLNQELDEYISFLRCIIRGERRNILNKKATGTWDYYAKRLRKWEPLWKYVSNEEFEWKDIVRKIEKMTSRDKK